MNRDTTAPLTFGILVFDEVEVLDLGGPFEVFSTAGRLARTADDEPLLRVLTVAAAGRVVRARGGLKVMADHTLAEDPPFDVLVVPGGVTTAVEADATVIDWLTRRRQSAALTFSICTGAFLLAATGALDGRAATTHWEDQEELARRWPGTEVRSDVRWVDDGDVVTSAGISAGIDASLHLVGRLFGEQLARRTAHQMEYVWTPSGPHQVRSGGPRPPRHRHFDPPMDSTRTGARWGPSTGR
ncbi:DJ-1/PfpI family protein [Kitasatospora sp. CMC57]|uniref:DJ-1/PfpI family protein n=1 Tax=Kitasatospora sp. CMC57 TaxID=3231513 RepID=A0AB33K4N4_9ACTN